MEFNQGDFSTETPIELPVITSEESEPVKPLTSEEIRDLQIKAVNEYSDSRYVQDRLRAELNHLNRGHTRPGGRVF